MIVVAGEALIDLLPTADRDGQPALRPAIGGSPLNVALGLGRLGRRTAFLGAVSTDAFGAQIMAALQDSRVDTALVMRVARPTPLAVASLSGGEARYAFYDAGTASRGMTLRELAPHPVDATWLHFGSIALAAEPAASTLIARAKTVARSTQSPCLVSYDPNVRPDFATDEAPYRRNLDQAMEVADLIKLSHADLAWMRPGITADGFAREQIVRGASLVVVTRGNEGAEAFTRQHGFAVPAPQVEVADTIGAGDAFMAGLLCALDEAHVRTRTVLAALPKKALLDAISFAACVAAVTCSKQGAVMPWREELQASPSAHARASGHPGQESLDSRLRGNERSEK
ncbi:MAG: carbohydrate kinase [Rhizobiales bacterium]|nr:carbohydrate kinase [Hyphomicrobiales bacterium]